MRADAGIGSGCGRHRHPGALPRTGPARSAVAFDMGGTTAKAGVIHGGEALTATAALIGGYNQALPVQIPMMDIFEVGTGGGSIAEVDVGDALRVGPKSAGAEPGPACYGRGGEEPTVTDANLVLGRLDANHFLGGEMKLDAAAAVKAIDESIAGRCRSVPGSRRRGDHPDCGHRDVLCGQGRDRRNAGSMPAAFTMIAYGGAGPLHAVRDRARDRHAARHHPFAPGHFSAFGMLFADLRYDSSSRGSGGSTDVSFDEVRQIYTELMDAGPGRASPRAISSRRRSASACRRHAICRPGASRHDRLPPDAVRPRRRPCRYQASFRRGARRRYGTRAPAEPAEFVSLRATVAGVMHAAFAAAKRAWQARRPPIALCVLADARAIFPKPAVSSIPPMFDRVGADMRATGSTARR